MLNMAIPEAGRLAQDRQEWKMLIMEMLPAACPALICNDDEKAFIANGQSDSFQISFHFISWMLSLQLLQPRDSVIISRMETSQVAIRKSGLRTWFHNVTHCLYLTTLTFVRCAHTPFVKVGCTSALAAELIQQWTCQATKVETCGPNGGIGDEVTVKHRRWLPVGSLPGTDVDWSQIGP